MKRKKDDQLTSDAGKRVCGELLTEALMAQELRIVHIPPNGNCLFAAIAEQLQGYKHLELRAIAVKYMREHQEEFRRLIQDGDNLGAYLDRMSMSGTWGSDMEAQALANSLQVNIHIYEEGQGGGRLIAPREGLATQDVRILYNHYHYDSILLNIEVQDIHRNGAVEVIDLVDDEDDSEFSSVEKENLLNKKEKQAKEVKSKLEKDGYNVKFVKADGNCLFRAIAEQLSGFNQENHEFLRIKTVEYFNSHIKDFLEMAKIDDESIDVVRESISTLGRYECSGLLLQVIADYLQLDIQVYAADPYFYASRTKVITRENIVDLKLYLNHFHFWAVIRADFIPIDISRVLPREVIIIPDEVDEGEATFALTPTNLTVAIPEYPSAALDVNLTVVVPPLQIVAIEDSWLSLLGDVYSAIFQDYGLSNI